MRRILFGPRTDIGGGYATVLAQMQADADAIAHHERDESFWIGEHTLTVTLGRSLKARTQLIAPPGSVEVVEVERGGGATMHNPGQVVVYPLLRLSERGLSPVTYLRELERVIISVLAEDGVEARAEEGKTGVWTGDKKIASLGVSVVSGVTRHGLALNVSNSLDDFRLINPCGFGAETMTSVAKLKGGVSFDAYVLRMSAAIERSFNSR